MIILQKDKKQIKTISSDNLPLIPGNNTANSAEFVPTPVDTSNSYIDPLNEVFDFVPQVQNKYRDNKKSPR